jgi:hypothetical protein
MMNCKGLGMKRSWPNLKTLSWHLPGGTEKNNETLSQDSRSPSRDLNPRPPDYEGVLTIRKRCSVKFSQDHHFLFFSLPIACLKSLKTLRITTFRRIGLALYLGGSKGRDTPILLDPVDRAIPDHYTGQK